MPVIEDLADFADALPARGAVMGLDLGTRTIGLAVSDVERMIATPLVTIRRTKFTNDAEALLDRAREREVAGFVLGLPRNMDGSEGRRCQSTRAFARNLARLTELPITFSDERLTTVEAENRLLAADLSRKRRRAVIDRMAAAIILQEALERMRRTVRSVGEDGHG